MEEAAPISRLIAFVVAPVIAAVTPVLVNAAQSLAGIDLDGDQLAILLSAVVFSELAVVFKWLDGRSKWETATAVEPVASAGDPGVRRSK